MIRLSAARLAFVLGLLAVLLAAVVTFALLAGPAGLSFGQVVEALTSDARGVGELGDASPMGGGGRGAGPASNPASTSAAMAYDIVVGVRLPRVLLGVLVGAALATAGAVFQALLRNPLADPYVLGVSGGAALAGIAVLALAGIVALPTRSVPVAAFLGGIVSTALLYWVSGGRGGASATSLLLTGVVFNAVASAGIVFLASIAGFFEGSRIFLWLIGQLSAVESDAIGFVAASVLLGLAVACALARSLNLLALGDASAAQLGVPVEAHRRLLLLATSLMVGAAVSVSGLIGFVGLIVPHALRLVVGSDHRLLVPASALAGAAFLVLSDTLARTLVEGRELPVGAVTALLGGPLFIVLLRRSQLRSRLP